MTEDETFAGLLHHMNAGLKPGDSVTPAIWPSAVYHLPGDPAAARHVYGRYSNPTWETAEKALGALEGAETILFPSGMAAIAAAFFTRAKAGGRILIPADGYHATRALAAGYLAKFGVEIVQRPVAQFDQGGVEGFDLILMETPSNPGLDVCDVAAIAQAGRAAGALVACDNTTMTPLGQRPLDLGCDLTVNAATKAINGHSDALSGYVATRDPGLGAVIRDWRKLSGSIPSPFDAWMVHRGLETLELRLARAISNAAALAGLMLDHKAVEAVRYPGLKQDPSFSLAQKQMRGFGFMLTATFRSAEAADRFILECPMVQASTSFGGLRTSAERRGRWGDGVKPGFVRISAGCEPQTPLLDAVAKTLDAIAG
jgi:cystathionine gamma-lyase